MGYPQGVDLLEGKESNTSEETFCDEHDEGNEQEYVTDSTWESLLHVRT